jgi:hypothetical protein
MEGLYLRTASSSAEAGCRRIMSVYFCIYICTQPKLIAFFRILYYYGFILNTARPRCKVTFAAVLCTYRDSMHMRDG